MRIVLSSTPVRSKRMRLKRKYGQAKIPSTVIEDLKRQFKQSRPKR